MSEELRRLLRAIAQEEAEEPKSPPQYEDSVTVILADMAGVPDTCPHCGSGYGVIRLLEFKKKQKIACSECDKYIATLEFKEYGWEVTDVTKKAKGE